MSEYKLKPIAPPDPIAVQDKDSVKSSVGSTPQREVIKKEDTGPVSVDYFGIEGWGEMLLEPRLDVYGLGTKVAKIETFLTEKCRELGAKDNHESKKQILEQLEKSLMLSEITKPHIRVDRVHSIIDYMEQFEMERRKRQFVIINVNKTKK
ncbi:MAG: hypothetical protein EHM30_10760 [Desulfobacteraceae bacterium]|nr:MAG: hypothetical protein EHM30_10760 [Desulfobacteraceae bacterium]